MVQWSKNKEKVNRMTKERRLPKPSDESINEGKDIINRLREKIEKEGIDNLKRDVLMCNVGH